MSSMHMSQHNVLIPSLWKHAERHVWKKNQKNQQGSASTQAFSMKTTAECARSHQEKIPWNNKRCWRARNEIIRWQEHSFVCSYIDVLPVHCKARDQSGAVFDCKVPRRPRKMECINRSLLQWRTNRTKQEESKQRATLSDNVSAGMQTLRIPDHSCRYWRHKRQTLEENGIHSASLWNRACTHSLHNHR